MTDAATGGGARPMWDADVASHALGIVAEEMGPGRAAVRMKVTDAMINGHGVCHGGYVFLLADTAFALACNSSGEATFAAGADIAFVSPARLGDELVATAAARATYGRSGIYDVSVHRADGELVAEFRGRSRTPGRNPAG